jgi:hypothetical protein
MRKSRFSEPRIIAILKEHEAGMSTGRGMSPARDLAADLLFVEAEVRWQKTSDARRKEVCREVGDWREGVLAAPGVLAGRFGAQGLPASLAEG